MSKPITPQTNTSTLVASELRKSYKKRTVVNHVSVQISQGEVVGLLGPNGAGKTTCFYMIVGLVKPDSGSITLDNKAITHLPMHKRAKFGLGYLPQEASVFRKLTVKENILAILELRKELSRKRRLSLCNDLLEEFSITHIESSLGMSLSGGERRRVEIARALASEPKFILLDEPFAGIDPISVSEIKTIITHLTSRGIGVLITDHNVRETLAICDRAYIMSSGNLICHGDAKTVLADKQVREVYLGEEFNL